LVENSLARALLQGQFGPGSRIVADADVVSGTIVFSADGKTVVAQAGRRDARAADDSSNGNRVGAGAGGKRRSAFDLPATEPRRRGDGEDLVN
jgi:hypothetical protein